jgi:hypothetical protein
MFTPKANIFREEDPDFDPFEGMGRGRPNEEDEDPFEDDPRAEAARRRLAVAVAQRLATKPGAPRTPAQELDERAEALRERIHAAEFLGAARGGESARLAGKALGRRNWSSVGELMEPLDELIYFLKQAQKDGAKMADVARMLGARAAFATLAQHAQAQDKAVHLTLQQEPSLCAPMTLARALPLRLAKDWGVLAEARESMAALIEEAGCNPLRSALTILAFGPIDADLFEAAWDAVDWLSERPGALDDVQRLVEVSAHAQLISLAGAQWCAKEPAPGAFADKILEMAKKWPAEKAFQPMARKHDLPVTSALTSLLKKSYPKGSREEAFALRWIDLALASARGFCECPSGLVGLAGAAHGVEPAWIERIALRAKEAGRSLDDVDGSGWTLLGLANDFSQNARLTEGTRKAWLEVAKALLTLGANPWGLIRQRDPQDFCENGELRVLAAAAVERRALSALSGGEARTPGIMEPDWEPTAARLDARGSESESADADGAKSPRGAMRL